MRPSKSIMDYAIYYRILGLQTTATQEEIKRAYRKLAAQYHPDRNPGGEAQFLRIKEAYEILSGKQVPRTTHTHTHTQAQNTTTTANTSTRASKTQAQTREERIKAAQKRYEDQKRKEEQQSIYLYNKLINGNAFRVFKYGSFVSLLVGILLVLDLFLPPIEKSNQDYNSYLTEEVRGYILENVQEQLSDSTISMNDIEITDFAKASTGYVHSRIFKHQRKQGENKSNDDDDRYLESVWSIIIFMPLPIIALWYKRRNATFFLMFYASLYIIIPLGILTLIVNSYILLQYLTT